ncbi:hypothetical protein F4823DRAFT_460790 [Ustulina deusta]|nr:hypothetical protein F4823DRAFT_460790 [Ustulina deusta]
MKITWYIARSVFASAVSLTCHVVLVCAKGGYMRSCIPPDILGDLLFLTKFDADRGGNSTLWLGTNTLSSLYSILHAPHNALLHTISYI